MAACRDAYACLDEVHACAHKGQQPCASLPRRRHPLLLPYPTGSFHCAYQLLVRSTASLRQKVAEENAKQK